MLIQVTHLVAGRNERDNVLVILCRHRTVKKEKKKVRLFFLFTEK